MLTGILVRAGLLAAALALAAVYPLATPVLALVMVGLVLSVMV